MTLMVLFWSFKYDSENAIYGRVGFNNGGRLKIMLRKDSNDYDFTEALFSDSHGGTICLCH